MTDTLRNDEEFRQIYPFQQQEPWYAKNVYPTDVDGLIERNRFFMIQEFKFGSTPQTRGQQMAIDRLNRRTMLFLISHKADANKGKKRVLEEHITHVQIRGFDPWVGEFRETERMSCSWNGLGVWCRAWWAMADEGDTVFMEQWRRRTKVTKAHCFQDDLRQGMKLERHKDRQVAFISDFIVPARSETLYRLTDWNGRDVECVQEWDLRKRYKIVDPLEYSN